MSSPRMRRIADYFAAQEELLHEMWRQVEMETAPLSELLQRQQTTTQQSIANLEQQLRPLNEYADAEEANLSALEQRMAGIGMDFVARTFAEQVEAQRERIAETRAHIDEQRAPFLRYDEDGRGTVEVALARFDDDISALEQNLADQRRVMLRMLEAMRSGGFIAVKDLLLGRQSALEELVRSGETDPAMIAAEMQALRADLPADGAGAHLQQVVAAADSADQRLATAGIARPRRVLSRAREAITSAQETSGVAAPTA